MTQSFEVNVTLSISPPINIVAAHVAIVFVL